MDVGAIQAATAASTASYRSFADATRSALDLLERLMPDCTVYLAHLDRTHAIHRIVDVRRGAPLGLRSNLATALAGSLDFAMLEGQAPRLCNDVADEPAYAALPMQAQVRAGAYLGIPLELSDGARVGSLAALSADAGRFRDDDEQLFAMLARVLAHELERESNERDRKQLGDTLRVHARGMSAAGRVARALAGRRDARPAVCRAACDIAGAPIAFLLEPSGRDLVSTAMYGADVPPVTLRPRPDRTGRAFGSLERYFVADARRHPALGQPLVDATAARSALFEPVLRDGQVAGVLLVLWQVPVESLPEAAQELLGALAAQAAAAIEHAAMRARLAALALTDELTGVATRRVLDEELPRELARARRSEEPVSLALLDVDHLGTFNMLRGEREGDRLIKEAAALWRAELREVDVMARLDGGRFGIILPDCRAAEAIEVLDRLRAATPRGQTSSAGVARWDGEEPAELLEARCAEALDAAKLAGRDVTLAAD